MAYLSIPNVKIKGVAAAVPTNVKEIKDLSFYTPNDAAKTIAITHVERTRIVGNGLCCSDLCYEAADRLLNELSWNRDEVDAIIYVALSRDYLTPATAGLLQYRLGISKECYAIDVPLACSGYVYGLSVVSSLISTGGIRKALLLVGETTSFLQSPLDKTLWPLHGDAGTVTALEYDENSECIQMHLATDGSRGESIMNRDGGQRYPVTRDSLESREYEPGVIRNQMQSKMDGMNVFSFSVKDPPASMRNLCEHFHIDMQSIDYLLLHQANHYMDEKIGKKLNIPAEKIPYSMMQYGNTSSASIPMTMVVGVGKELEQKKVLTLMCGFGAGLSWGSALITLDHIKCLDLIEVPCYEKT
ncbi:ketoacyl-ACP synthase III [Bacteroides fluxus]|uniref:ketoacyl-ACP synthase III n=1 Tax=Bacteroides fluxus TaxID=626930 RepID=UPI0023A8CC28|nr:ketoacyl-ACP synthase III [Bacteroides fluxus]